MSEQNRPLVDARAAVVTGAAGFIGLHLVHRLGELGVGRIVGIDNERSGDWSRVPEACERVHRDLADMGVDELAATLSGCDVLFHLAAEKYNSSKSTPQKVYDVNVSATRRLFEAAARAGVARVVFTSSLYAYGSLGPAPMHETDLPRPRTDYGISKLAGEHMLHVLEREHGLSWAAARLFFVYGPRQFAEGGYKSVILKNFERLRAGEAPTVFGDGEQSLDYVYVDDVVDALLLLQHESSHGALCNIGGGTGVTINALTKSMVSIAGVEVTPEHLPPDWTAGTSRVADIGAAASRLGWAPRTSLEAGLERVWRWMEEEEWPTSTS